MFTHFFPRALNFRKRPKVLNEIIKNQNKQKNNKKNNKTK